MVETAKTTETARATQTQGQRAPTSIDAPGAPFVYFEVAPGLRNADGIVTLSLVATKIITMTDGQVDGVPVITGYLKGTPQALLSLRSAIDGARLLGVRA